MQDSPSPIRASSDPLGAGLATAQGDARAFGSGGGSAPARHDGRAERPLRWLLAALVVLPVAVFGIAAAISYRAHEIEARGRVERDLGRIYEHALKVFETFDLSARYLDEMLADVTDEQIRAAEGLYHARLKAIVDTLPQLADLWVIDADGHPVVSGTVYPMPRLDLSDRRYFSVHKNGEVEGLYIDDVVESRARNTRGQVQFFALSRKRVGPDGRFAGVTTISSAPDYFSQYYAQLPAAGVSALVRADGAVLARFPNPTGEAGHLHENGPVMAAMRAQPLEGMLTVRSTALGDVERIIAYRKLPDRALYVVAGADTADIVRGWANDMSKHLIFGVPATLAMFGLGVMALRRTRREGAAHEQLRLETARREASEQALRQAQKMEAVGRLTGGIAHDFNNLLTAILGNIDLALRRLTGDNERVVKSLTVARQASERAAMLVHRLLAFSRQHPLEVKAVDINRLVQGMSELFRRTIGETITIETVLAGGLWKSAVDPNQLENAILNLAVNARDAMPDGGRLTLETANAYLDESYVAEAGGDVPHGQYVMLAVSDSGAGMSREVIDRAFEPFFTTKPVGLGSGLGLSQVYGFVKQSGGHIRIYSEVGEGSTIKLYFPRLSDQAGVPPWRTDEVEDAPPLARSDRSETILLVEDDEQVNRFASEALQDRGYRVVAAPDGPTALRLLGEQPDIELLFTDVVLPGGMNGRQLADEVRRLRPAMKVLFATGYTRNAIIHQGRLDADVELLTKPFTADALGRKIRQILDGGSPVRANGVI